MERFGNERLIRECKQHRERILLTATIPMHETIGRLLFEEMSHFILIVHFDQMCVENNAMTCSREGMMASSPKPFMAELLHINAGVVNMAMSALPHIHVYAVIFVQEDVFSTVCDLVDSDDSLKDFHEPF